MYTYLKSVIVSFLFISCYSTSWSQGIFKEPYDIEFERCIPSYLDIDTIITDFLHDNPKDSSWDYVGLTILKDRMTCDTIISLYKVSRNSFYSPQISNSDSIRFFYTIGMKDTIFISGNMANLFFQNTENDIVIKHVYGDNIICDIEPSLQFQYSSKQFFYYSRVLTGYWSVAGSLLSIIRNKCHLGDAMINVVESTRDLSSNDIIPQEVKEKYAFCFYNKGTSRFRYLSYNVKSYDHKEPTLIFALPNDQYLGIMCLNGWNWDFLIFSQNIASLCLIDQISGNLKSDKQK